MIFKLKHDKNVNLATINELCKMFECNLLDVIEYIPDEEAEMKQKKYQSRVINIFSIFLLKFLLWFVVYMKIDVYNNIQMNQSPVIVAAD